MTQIKKILINKNPQAPNLKPFEISINELLEYEKNNSIKNGFSGELQLFDETLYSFTFKDDTCFFYHIIETDTNENENKHVFAYVPPDKVVSLIKAIDKFSVWLNARLP